MYELLDAVGNFIKQVLGIFIADLRVVGPEGRVDVLELLASVGTRIGEAKVALEEEVAAIYKRNRVENEKAFIARVCFPEYFGDRIKVGETSSFKLKKNYAVLLGCDDWDYPEERDEYDSISPEQYEIGAAMRERMRVITGTGYGEFERARRFFAFEGKIAFIKLVRELTMDLRNGDGSCVVGLKQAKEFTEAAHEEVTEDVLIAKADLRRLLERYIVN